MLQQFLALLIVLYFLNKLFWQKRRSQMTTSEFIFWLVFWLLVGVAIVFIKRVDAVVARLGFSGSGIEVLLYLGVVMLFYFVFRLRLRLEKMERDITKIVRFISSKNK